MIGLWKMACNIITFGKNKENFELAIRACTIGSFLGTFKDHLRKGSNVFLHCDGQILAVAKVSSDYFFSNQKIWEDKVYPHRFRISDIVMLKTPIKLVNGIYNVELRKRYGTGWAYKFLFSPKPLPEDISNQILSEIGF